MNFNDKMKNENSPPELESQIEKIFATEVAREMILQEIKDEKFNEDLFNKIVSENTTNNFMDIYTIYAMVTLSMGENNE